MSRSAPWSAAQAAVATLAVMAALPATAAGQTAEAVRAADRNQGWIELFDGESLAGWTTVGGRYDGKAVWTVEDGVIVGREGPGRAGGLLYTEQEFHSFDLELEAWIDYPFDSGVFLRMVPEAKGAQVTLDYRPGGEVGAIYSEGWLQHRLGDDRHAPFRREAWNRVRVRCVGRDFRVEVEVNGEHVMSYRLPAGSTGYAASGHIGLQVHGASNSPEGHRCMFRNVRVRPLPVFDPEAFACADDGQLVATEAGRAAGWRSLLDPELSAWANGGPGSGFVHEDGELRLLKEGSQSTLRTKADDLRDFEYRMDFVLEPLANSGLFLRADPEGGNPAYSGCEIQLLDDWNWEREFETELKPWQFTGSLYGAVPAQPADAPHKAFLPLGRWNTMWVRYVGDRLAVELNGRLLYDVDTTELEGAQPPFADRADAGFLGLQRHAPADLEGRAYARFRNVFLRRVTPSASAGSGRDG